MFLLHQHLLVKHEKDFVFIRKVGSSFQVIDGNKKQDKRYGRYNDFAIK